jgi:hypothetical protein
VAALIVLEYGMELWLFCSYSHNNAWVRAICVQNCPALVFKNTYLELNRQSGNQGLAQNQMQACGVQSNHIDFAQTWHVTALM